MATFRQLLNAIGELGDASGWDLRSTGLDGQTAELLQAKQPNPLAMAERRFIAIPNYLQISCRRQCDGRHSVAFRQQRRKRRPSWLYQRVSPNIKRTHRLVALTWPNRFCEPILGH